MDGKHAANLRLQLWNSDPNELIQSAAAAPIGSHEALFRVSLAAGRYRIRVDEEGTQTEPQLYYLTLRVSPFCPGDVDGDFTVDDIDRQHDLDAFNAEYGDEAYDPLADLNCDDAVDNTDLQEVLDYLYETCS